MQDLISLGMQGMMASYKSLNVTGNNLNNIDTPGFSRPQAMWTNNGKFGGVNISEVRRIYAQSNLNALQNSVSEVGKWNAYVLASNPLNNLLGTTDNVMQSSINELFTSLNNLSANSADLTARKLFLQSANNLTAQFNNLHANLQEQQVNLANDLQNKIDQTNQLSVKIAELNKEIAQNPSNEMLDARDVALAELASLVEVNVVKNGNSCNVYVKSGQALVISDESSQITTDKNGNLLVNTKNEQLPLTNIGGAIGGLLDFQKNTLLSAKTELGKLAQQISSKFNQNLSKYVDLNGDFGANLFSDLSGLKPEDCLRMFKTVLFDPAKIGLANPISVTNSEDTKSNLTASITNTGDNLANQLPLTFKVLENNKYQILNNKNEVINNGNLNNNHNIDLTLKDGSKINFNLTDTYKSGDTFNINKTNKNSNDNSGVIELNKLQNDFNKESNNISSDIGLKINHAENQLQTNNNILDKYIAMRDVISGVNLDEETANILKFQQYYDANAQLIKTAQTTFNTLLNVI